MFIFRLLKWFLYIFSTIAALSLTTFLIFSFIDRQITINETTKTCLVTGASSGIGRAISVEMVKRGWKVIGIARREEKLKELERELGAAFIPYKCDVSIPEQIHKVTAEIKKQQLKPTLFFLNSGTGDVEIKFQPMLTRHKQTFDTNYFGVITWIDEWINNVKTYGGGTFVVTSSVNAIFGYGASYCASKAAINACFKALRLQYYYDKIGFVIVMPGPIATDMLKTPKPLPFTHQPEAEALYIIKQIFKGKKQIEPSWFYSFLIRILNYVPDCWKV
ncbi:TPA: short-chain dehydrogenase [Candidatus Dependentiae bacterium]|nr:MAG: Short chain dehydrogenase [candidate division TM6 bacterium GW2011_GWE2_31_21]KKP54036.1 MAG: Short chain dehydrogenase [candidate division TM6 bacterium GW2011_GWF2_33_332]HBS48382.1 short-chain dehydrogenase [Candidatus Dependentiae bacterium]HBZ72944.1 short-chain dehydrogenase [Candidatus Dependentiae bacterium]